MVHWFITEERLSGFTYYPLLEIGVGIFLMLAALAMPVLFVYYNGIKPEQWAELLFCAGFLVLFMFMGKSLTFQSMQARQTSEGFSFFQNLREPAVLHTIERTNWLGIKTVEEKKGEETFTILQIKTPEGELDFYKSLNKKEINKMVGALVELQKKAEEAQK
ncbi:MAG: hypothetical protein PHD82_11840 [Candidatus Riflebacteria bacterium]|nr:hypothetical protein [Candidatus Riflebacteria bacterium]